MRVTYLGKSWKVIDTLPSGSLVLCRWVRDGIPTVFGKDIPYFYRGVLFVSPAEVKEKS